MQELRCLEMRAVHALVKHSKILCDKALAICQGLF
jgi:hypothetical protein